ncbi:MAG: hypothetical protein ABSA83_10235 [Verrucomicrobiota bacterium]|jgi:hypothetical protein
MKQKSSFVRFSQAIAAAMAVCAISSHAQVNVTATLTDVPASGGVFDYTLKLNNTGPEAVESFWLGWFPGSFNVASPSSPGNTLGWSEVLDGSSIQFGGTSGTALDAGHSGVFTFDSTSTPSQFESGTAGESTAYGVDAAQLAFTLTSGHTEVFTPTMGAAPDQSSTLGLLAVGSIGLLVAFRCFSCSRSYAIAN